MKQKDMIDVEFRLSQLERNARDLHVMLLHERPGQAAKFLKIAEYSANFHTFLRVNEDLPPDPAIMVQNLMKKRLGSGGK